MDNKKIQIVTVYKSMNFGSYLQAEGLYRVLSAYGKVEFLDSKTRSLSFRKFLRDCKKKYQEQKTLISKIKVCVFELREYLNYCSLWRSLPHSEKSKANITVLGSDEIWNIKRKHLIAPVYFGAGIKSYKVAYAPSVNNSNYEDFLDKSEYIELLNSIDSISVRDKKSKELVERITGKEIPIVLDPTLLTDAPRAKFSYPKHYIAVYLFGNNIDEADIAEIRRFAERKGLAIIGCGLYFDWCDACYHSKSGNPFYIYEAADYVITNTFHGTAYAINYQKNFASIVKKNDKVLNLLDSFGLSERAVSSGKEIEGVLSRDVDVDGLRAELKILREKSLNFLECSFGVS